MSIKEIVERKNGLLSAYFSRLLNKKVQIKEIIFLGEGVHGEAYKALTTSNESFILKEFKKTGRNLHFPEDRIRESLLFKRTASEIPSHVKVFDVIQYKNNSIVSLDDKTPIIVMEEARYDDYFSDLKKISEAKNLDEKIIKRIKIIAEKLAEIHTEQNSEFYARYLKDWFGFGILELLNELEEIASDKEILQLKHAFIEWENKLAKRADRCKRIHGELFPGTIKFGPNDEFITFDMRRIGAGEPADDVGSMAYNFLFYSINNHNKIIKCFEDAAKLFIDEYMEKSKDKEILNFLPVFMAYRCLICVHPKILPLTIETKKNLKKLLFILLKQKNLDISKLVKLYNKSVVK